MSPLNLGSGPTSKMAASLRLLLLLLAPSIKKGGPRVFPRRTRALVDIPHLPCVLYWSHPLDPLRIDPGANLSLHERVDLKIQRKIPEARGLQKRWPEFGS